MFKKILSAAADLVMEDDGKKSQPTAAPSPTPGVSTATVSSGAIAGNNEYVTLLRQSLTSRSTAFTALRTAAEKLQDVIPDANMRLKAAYKMVQAEGRGLTELLQAIEIHANDLASQERQFLSAAEQTLGNSIGTMERELAALGQTNDSARAQIDSLQQQIANLNTTIANNSVRQTELNSQISTERAHFDSSKIQFGTALSLVQAELNQQKSIISSTLA